jgi:hypothetical protein
MHGRLEMIVSHGSAGSADLVPRFTPAAHAAACLPSSALSAELSHSFIQTQGDDDGPF